MPPNGTLVAESLDAADYNPIAHLNTIFSHPSTLSSISKTSHVLQAYQDDLDDDIDELEEDQSASNLEAVERIQESKADLEDLFRRIEGIRERALQTERHIAEMTADIKQLDKTKKNLTLSMTALKRLQMLTTAYEQLRALSKTRQYRECAQLLQAVIQLMAHFKSYRSIDQIATLSRNVADLQRELLEQVCEDFEITFAKDETGQKRGVLAEGCLVMDALGENARSRLVTWYCNTQLREYRQVFRGNEEAGSLDNISRRYSWFKRMLKTYDEEHAAIFPVHWRVNEVLANIFCEGTKEDYKGILLRTTRSGQPLDVNLLLSCLQETLDFEHSLERRFSNASRASIDTVASSEIANFNLTISDAFEPYLSVWVESQDKQLSSMIPKYRLQSPKPPEEEFSVQGVISSASELFNFYRHALAQCAKLSTGQPLLNLSRVFSKYLDQYAQQVLLFYISERPTGGTPSRVPTMEDTILVLNTADYCYNTCTALEEKIRGRVDEQYKSSIDLQSQADSFMGIASAAVRILVRRVEVDLEPCWREMRNLNWTKMENVIDQSSYVGDLQSSLKDRAGTILEMLHKQQYARAFADNLVELLASTYLINLVHCRPLSEVGAEQMLLDLHSLRQTLLHLMSNEPPASYAKRVTSTFGRIEPLLKTLQVRPSPPEALIQAYLIHIADLSDTNFRKILDIKGIRGTREQGQLIELFQMHKLSERYKSSLVDRSPLLTPLSTTAGSTTSGPTTGAAAAVQGLGALGTTAAASLSTANLSGNMKFDPSGLGNAIMDRFASPHLGGSGTPARDGALSPPPVGDGLNALNSLQSGEAGAKLNENLKNIGKFFKRDLSTFGGRFGGSGTRLANLDDGR